MKSYVGKIVTLDSENHIYKYLVEDCGRIVFVGDELPQEYKDAQVIDLGEQVIVPSFCDTHEHFLSFSLFYSGLDVMEARSNDEIKEMVKEYAEKTNKKTLLAFGASPYSVKEKRLLSRSEETATQIYENWEAKDQETAQIFANRKKTQKIYLKF